VTEEAKNEQERVANDSLLKKQLDQKWRTLDQFEASLRKLEAHKLQWKAKYAIKEGELEAAKVCPLSFPSPSQPFSNAQSGEDTPNMAHTSSMNQLTPSPEQPT